MISSVSLPIRRAGPGSQVNQLFNAGPCSGDGQILQKSAQLHNESYLAGSEIFADEDRCNQCNRDQHISLDIKSSNQADQGL